MVSSDTMFVNEMTQHVSPSHNTRRPSKLADYTFRHPKYVITTMKTGSKAAWTRYNQLDEKALST